MTLIKSPFFGIIKPYLPQLTLTPPNKTVPPPVDALKQIHAELTTKLRTLEREKAHSQHILDSYHALGDEFNILVSHYDELKKRLETYQWALNLQKTTSS